MAKKKKKLKIKSSKRQGRTFPKEKKSFRGKIKKILRRKNKKAKFIPLAKTKKRVKKNIEELLRKEKKFQKEAEKIFKAEHFAERRKQRREDEQLDPHADDENEQTLDRTSMRIYLDQIENIPLLTPEDEISLAEKIRTGGKGSEDARHRMIRSNLRLVIALAKRYAHMGLAFSDLVEEGNIGLMRAVEKFDPKRGYRFSTYAAWWIKQGMMRSLSNHGKTIRIPVYMYDLIGRWRRVRDALIQRLNRIPARAEVAKMLEVSQDKVEEIEGIVNRPSSLNAPISLDSSAELLDMIEDDDEKNPDKQVGEILKSERVLKLLKILDEREREMIVRRFGLQHHNPHTLEEIAKDFNVTRERVRQIEVSVLKKIRAHLELEGDRFENYLQH